MECKTHIACGLAITTAILHPATIKLLGITAAAATIGSIISDVDVSTSESHKSIVIITTISTTALIVCTLIECFFNVGLFRLIQRQTDIAHIIGGFILFLAICTYGMKKPHRTFMHSILGLILLTVCTHTILPSAAIPFALGMASHIGLDLFNRKKVQLLFPLKNKYGLKLCESNGYVNNLLLSIGTFLFLIELCVFTYTLIF